jgi:hypothetical protein
MAAHPGVPEARMMSAAALQYGLNMKTMSAVPAMARTAGRAPFIRTSLSVEFRPKFDHTTFGGFS